MLISLLFCFLLPYNWLGWLLLHWAMLLVPSKHSKPLSISCSIIGWKTRFPQFSSSFSFFLSFFLSSFFFKTSYPCPTRASWVSFFTVLQHLGWGCATTGSKEERRHFLLMNSWLWQCVALWFEAFKLLLTWYAWIKLTIVLQVNASHWLFAQERST